MIHLPLMIFTPMPIEGVGSASVPIPFHAFPKLIAELRKLTGLELEMAA